MLFLLKLKPFPRKENTRWWINYFLNRRYSAVSSDVNKKSEFILVLCLYCVLKCVFLYVDNMNVLLILMCCQSTVLRTRSLIDSIIIIILALSTALSLSLSQRVTTSLTGRTSTFGSGSNREDKVETPVNSGPDPCLPEICDKMSVRQSQRVVSYFSSLYCRCCSCLDDTWIHGKWYLFRSVIHDIVDNPFFEWTVLLLIFASRSGSLN